MMWGKQCIFPPNYSLLPVLSSEWVLHFNILTIHFICEIRTFTGVIGLFIFFTSTCFWTSVAITTSIIIISGNFVFKFIIVKIKVILMSWTTVSRSVNDDYIWYSYSKKDQNLDKNTYFSVELKNSYFLHWNFDWKSCFVVFFLEWNEWKNPQFNFSSQNPSIEHNFFKWDGKKTKILHLLFHRIVVFIWYFMLPNFPTSPGN